MRIALVADSSTQRATPAPAWQLYASTRFQLARRYAAAHADRWYVLSTQHGLVAPRAVLAPYNVCSAATAHVERQAWAARVAQELARYNQPETTWLILAGPTATEELLPLLRGPIAQPLHGLGLGSQVQWLQRALGPQARAATPEAQRCLLGLPAGQRAILDLLHPTNPRLVADVLACCPAWSLARLENVLRSLAERGLARCEDPETRPTWYAAAQ